MNENCVTYNYFITFATSFEIFMTKMKHFTCLLSGLIMLLLCSACTGCRQSGSTPATDDSIATPPSVTTEETDTLWGFVGDGTSMHLIELVNADATDTLLLELEDDADHRATLAVGREIGVAVKRLPDGQQTVLATFDAE